MGDGLWHCSTHITCENHLSRGGFCGRNLKYQGKSDIIPWPPYNSSLKYCNYLYFIQVLYCFNKLNSAWIWVKSCQLYMYIWIKNKYIDIYIYISRNHNEFTQVHSKFFTKETGCSVLGLGWFRCTWRTITGMRSLWELPHCGPNNGPPGSKEVMEKSRWIVDGK